MLRSVCWLRCRYDQLNKNALRDVELFDKIGRVRTPSPVPFCDSEEDIVAASKGEDEGGKNDSDQQNFQPHGIPCHGDEVEEGCSSPKTPECEELESDTSADGDTDCDFQPSDEECDTENNT